MLRNKEYIDNPELVYYIYIRTNMAIRGVFFHEQDTINRLLCFRNRTFRCILLLNL